MTTFKLDVQVGGTISSQFTSAIQGSSAKLEKLGSKLANFKRQQAAIKKVELGEASLDTARGKYRAAALEVTRLRRAMAQTGPPTKQLVQSFEKARQKSERLSKSVSEQRERLHKTRQALRETGLSTDNLADDNRRLGQSVDKVTKQYTRLGKTVNKQSLLRQKRSDLRGKLFDAAALGATVAAPLAIAVNFEQSVAKLGAITFSRGLSDEENAKNKSLLEEEAKRLGKETQFTASQSANAMTFLGMAGFDPEQVKGATAGVLNLAKAAGTDLAVTADISSNVLSGFGLDATQDMARVGDVLASTFTSSNTTLESLGQTMSVVAPFARDAGASIEQVAAMTGLLGDVGIQGSKAATALKATLLRLSAPTGSAKKALASLGVEVADMEGNLRPVPELLRDLSVATKSMGSVQRAGLLKDIFGEEPISGVSELLNQAGLTELDSEIAKAAKGGKGAAKIKEVFSRLSEPLEAASQKMLTLGISVSGTNGKLRPVPDLLKSLSNATSDLDESQRKDLLNSMFNKNDVATITTLLKKSTTNLLDAEIEKAVDSGGIADRISSQMSQTTLGSLQRLGAALESIAISVGNVLLPTIAGGAELFAGIASGISSFAETFPLLTRVITTAVVGIIGLRIVVIASSFAWLFLQSSWLTFTSTLGIGTKLLTLVKLGLVRLNALSSVTAIRMKFVTLAQWGWNAALGVWRGAIFLGSAAFTLLQAGLVRMNILSVATAARMAIVTAAQWAWNVALTANPIGLIIVGIGALIGGAVLLIKNWDKVKNFFSGLWEGIKKMTGTAVNWLLDTIGLLMNPFKLISKVTDFVVGSVSGFFGGDDEKPKSSRQVTSKNSSSKIGDTVNQVTAKPNDLSAISQAQSSVINQSSSQSIAIQAPITINSPPGADEAVIAQQVRQELEQRQSQANADRRSHLFDEAIL